MRESRVIVPISAEVILEARRAYRQVQRYRKTSSPLLLFLLIAPFPLMASLNLIPGGHQDFHVGRTCSLIAGLVFWIGLHTLQYRSLKKGSGEAQAKLDSLRTQYGPEIDAVAKEKAPLFAWRD